MSVFTVYTTANDVEDLLEAVADGLRRWEGGEVQRLDVPFPSAVRAPLIEQARQLRFQAHVDRDAIIHSTRPRLGPLLIRFQILVRRLTWWFLEPILQPIRLFQANVARVAAGLAQDQASLAAQVADLARRVEELEQRLGTAKDRE